MKRDADLVSADNEGESSMAKQKKSNDIFLPRILRAVIYVRVSTEGQADDGGGLEFQLDNCLKFCIEKGYEVVLVVEETYTGFKYRERKELSKIRQMIRNGEVDVLVINTLDRLSRVQEHFAVLFDEMKYYHVALDCVKEKFEDSIYGVFQRQVMGFVAEIDRLKILDRTEDGRKKRIEKGKMLTGNKPRYGYRWANEHTGEKGTYIAFDDEAKTVKRIYAIFTTVKSSCHGLTKILNDEKIPTPRGNLIWDRSVVYRILTDPFYIGKAYTRRFHNQAMKPQDEWIAMPEGTIPAIIDEETFYKAQEILRINREEALRNNKFVREELLRCGFIKCGYCKRNMSVHRSLRRHKKVETVETYYRCQYGHQSSIRCLSPAMIDTKRADKAVWDYVGELIQDFSLVERAIEIAKKKIHKYSEVLSVEQSIKNAKTNQDQLLADLNKKENGVFKLRGRAREHIVNELDMTEKLLEKLKGEHDNARRGEIEWEKMKAELDKFIAWCLNGRERYATASLEEKRRVLRNLGLVIYVYRKDDSDHEPYEIELAIPQLSEIVLRSF